MDADEIEIGGWWRAWVKGSIVAGVRGRESPQRVSRAVHAVFRGGGRLQSRDLDQILEEVKVESVDPFVGSTWREPERRERLDGVISALGLTKSPVRE
jgi:hypothetical protein